jgi:ABC-type transport system involved in Fe-S cluster assembly, ATPase component
MIEIKNLEASIDDKTILKGIDLQIPTGEVHVIMGRNGSGKSTLANVIAGNEAYEVDGGSISMNNTDITEMSMKIEL